jgi:hypothetical protein
LLAVEILRRASCYINWTNVQSVTELLICDNNAAIVGSGVEVNPAAPASV